MDWPTVTLSEVAEINPRLPKEMRSQSEMDVAFLQMASVSEQGGILDVELRKLEDVVKGFTYFAQGDVIVAKITPCMENGKAAYINHRIPTEIGFGSTEFHVIRPGPKLDGKYLFHLIWSDKFRFIAEKNMTGTAGQKRVPTSFIQRYKFALPPLDEQKRIVAILDKADEINHAQNSAFNMRQKLVNSTFESLFGPYFVNEDSFVELGELVESVRVGYVGPTSKHYRDQGVHYLRTGNVGHGSVITDGMKYITKEFHDSQKKSKLKTGDIVISRVIGDEIKCSIIPPELDDSNCGNVVIVTPSRQMNSIFLCHLILSHHTQRKLMRRKVGSAQSVVNTKVMKKMLVPKIPVQLQEQFAVIVESISRLQDPRHLSQKHSDSLIQDLLS